MTTPSNDELEVFVDELIAPYSVHRKKYARPHGIVARRELKNRMLKRIKPLLAQDRQELLKRIQGELVALSKKSIQ